ncbi:hypothetical protein JIN77_13970 [Verrucomicrobiaceae bacterium R5-34]|uniref:Uncharacterized protein n=1 Tax=Oceaniferula flava TaxID=2800421 RepID=A0AAE2SF02_9BACT|nr:hypothetical protein [Oceaniferula flavus]MBK1831837.1 hypothetical protein [Verrucomicrobiaceae bacterium R5-34]MBK1856162.1 hypothetical protein [Oceaniferula flavus]MBM1137469.1 hypothetical protein [Oceaniferula flavus]
MPDHFTSLETGKPFTQCCACEGLLSEKDMYIVNKSFAAGECVFELAMCFECREELNSKLSEESRVAMFDFMHDHADMEKREATLGSDSDTEDYIAKCLTCGVDAKGLNNYTLGGMFSGDHLIKGPFPMLICGSCEDKLNETISDETRDVWDKFIGEHFPGPPSEATLPTGSKPVFL